MSDQPLAFDDAAALQPPEGEVSAADLAATVAALIRADLAGDTPGAVARAFDAAPPGDRVSFAFAWGDAMALGALGDWIEADEDRRRRAAELALHLAPPDPAADENEAVLVAIRTFQAWDQHPYPVLIVPGYTPASLAQPAAGVHAVTQRRLERAARDLGEGMAPFILVSGGAVYPRGTPFAEGIEMKKALLALGLSADRVLVEARARHSSTNLRNAGRIMLAHGLAQGMIVTLGGGVMGSDVFGQDFYFAHPTRSTFHARCERELGYRVGELTAAGDAHIAFAPAPDVRRVGFRDALDP